MKNKIIDFDNIETIMLDMDGTLLDLHFDNEFWLNYLPQKYATKKGISTLESKRILQTKMKSKEGSLDWYSTDFWSSYLDLDVIKLKEEFAIINETGNLTFTTDDNTVINIDEKEGRMKLLKETSDILGAHAGGNWEARRQSHADVVSFFKKQFLS